MVSLPSGTVTFLFTDIEGSTRLAQEFPEAMPTLLARHNELIRKAVEAHNGFVFRVVGDSVSVAFHTASEALRAALAAQNLLQHESWMPAPIKVRMGIHTGNAQLEVHSNESSYSGYSTLALTQRIMSAGHGGQVLISQSVFDLTVETLPENVQIIDMGERQLKDVMHLEHLYQLVSPDLQSDFPPLKTLETLKHNLPQQLTSFIGREREMEEARKLLPQTRLLTFIGPGGTGKTRLSLQAAMEQLVNFKNGVWLVELAPIADPAYIISTIASIFKLREAPGVSLSDTLVDYMRGKQLLLIIDNCEHLVEACANLTDHLLHSCPNLKIIASSREALGIDGETIYRVPSLSLPQDFRITKGQGDFRSLMDYEAIRLFIERATKAEPRFQLTGHNAFSVAQICSRLDGIPLAIELAAARVKLFTPEQIAERLDDRFKLLTGGSRTALPRQQTLRALIDWSYQFLNEMEQRSLRRLAVFSGGWTFEAAESVLSESEAMDGLSGLVNKSLVNVEEQDGLSRYRFLETIRQYAMDKLLEAGEAVEARNCHLNYFLEFAKRAQEKFGTEQRPRWVNQLEMEHDNLRSALNWALESDPESALQMVCSLAGFWLSRSYMTEGCNWCQAAISRVEALSAAGPNLDRMRAQAYSALAMLSINHGEHHAGQIAARKGVALARRLDDHLQLARALHFLGMSFTFLGDVTLAFDSLHESEAICRKFGYNDDLASVLQSLAYATLEIHGPQAAEQLQSYLEESLSLSQGSADPEAAVRTEGILARLAFYHGDLAEARKHADLMLDLHKEMGDQLSVTGHQSGMAHVARQIGNFKEALALYRDTIREWQDIGHRGAVAHQLECFAFIAKAQEQPERAARLFGAAEQLREVSTSPMTPQERLEYEREVADLLSGMDEKIFASLWAEGRSMSLEQAIEFALIS